jgi:hypothetical protein
MTAHAHESTLARESLYRRVLTLARGRGNVKGFVWLSEVRPIEGPTGTSI